MRLLGIYRGREWVERKTSARRARNEPLEKDTRHTSKRIAYDWRSESLFVSIWSKLDGFHPGRVRAGDCRKLTLTRDV